jgi:hypothetical protein
VAVDVVVLVSLAGGYKIGKDEECKLSNRQLQGGVRSGFRGQLGRPAGTLMAAPGALPVVPGLCMSGAKVVIESVPARGFLVSGVTARPIAGLLMPGIPLGIYEREPG